MKNISLFLLATFLFASDALSNFKSDIKINSNSIEFLKGSNEVIFLDDIEINSEFVNIKAQSATYDRMKDVISLKGNPSFIKSKKEKNPFNGMAEKILFFNDQKIHLIGNASMKYKNISISSNKIIFNPQNGEMSSE